MNEKRKKKSKTKIPKEINIIWVNIVENNT